VNLTMTPWSLIDRQGCVFFKNNKKTFVKKLLPWRLSCWGCATARLPAACSFTPPRRQETKLQLATATQRSLLWLCYCPFSPCAITKIRKRLNFVKKPVLHCSNSNEVPFEIGRKSAGKCGSDRINKFEAELNRDWKVKWGEIP
jgi:hypothetical protein